MKRSRLAVIAAIATTVGCADHPTGSSAGASLQVVSDVSRADTVLAKAPTPLRIKVLGGDGQPAASATVKFTGNTSVIVTPAIVQTGSDGVASVNVEFGRVPGEVKLLVSVDAPSIRDSLAFTVRPGQAASTLLLSMRDTSLMVGDTMRSLIRIYDAYGNRRSDVVGITAFRAGSSAEMSVRGDTLTTVGRAPGRVIVAVHTRAPSDSLAITIFPAADAAAWLNGDHGTFQLTRLDGTHARTLATLNPGSGTNCAQWTSSGDRIVYTAGLNGGGSYYATVTGESGRLLATVPSGGLIFPPTYPEPSDDGQWLYVAWHSGYPDYYDERSIWRAHWDGSALQQIVPPVTRVSTRYVTFSLSHDGSRLIIQTSPYAENDGLELWDTRTGRGTDLHIVGGDPKWGPGDSLIAYVSMENSGIGGLHLIRADGTGGRVIGATGASYITHSWSPDGRWILATSIESLDMRYWLIDVASGEPFPLAGVRFQYNWSCRSWRPNPPR